MYQQIKFNRKKYNKKQDKTKFYIMVNFNFG